MNKVLLFFIFIFFAVNSYVHANSIAVKYYTEKDSITVKYDETKVVPKKFDSKKIEAYKKDSDFNYEEAKVKEPSLLERIFYWLKRKVTNLFEWIFGVRYARGVLGFIFSVLPYVIVALVLFLLLRFFFKTTSKSIVSNTLNKPVVSITDEEELIKSKDISKLIKQAIAQKNYRLAVRYYYLNILKQLEQNKLITWEQQKTNEDYIKEISKPTVQHSFEELTRLYDFVWYGNFKINEVEFTRVQSNFEHVKYLISKG